MLVDSSPFCLVYVSKAAPAEPAKRRLIVRNILTQAQHLNARDDITGLLIFNDDYFAQALEGPRDAVEQTFGRIARDERHALPTVVLRQSVEVRAFSRWTMCARQLSALDNQILDRLNDKGGFSPAAMPGVELLDALKGIARVHAAQFDRQTQSVVYL
jgi:hypothetical protein